MSRAVWIALLVIGGVVGLMLFLTRRANAAAATPQFPAPFDAQTPPPSWGPDKYLPAKGEIFLPSTGETIEVTRPPLKAGITFTSVLNPPPTYDTSKLVVAATIKPEVKAALGLRRLN